MVKPVYQAVAELLVSLGVTDVFGVVGSGNFHITNALCAQGARFIPARHEGGAITMADAWGRVTGRVGVCTVHQGPGLTNTITGLVEATKSRTPLLVLAADTSRGAIFSNFRLDQAHVIEASGAVVEHLYTAETAPADALRAWRRASLERRPVVLMMPLDVQQATTAETIQASSLPPVSTCARPSDRDVVEVARRLRDARRPLILAGRGAVISGARDVLEELADRTGALLATSAVANGLFAGNPWYLGITGGFSTPTAVELMGQADLVLVFGASLNSWTLRHGTLLNRQATVIQVDADASALGKQYDIALGLVGDARATAEALLTALEGHTADSSWRTPEICEAIGKSGWRHVAYQDASDGEQIDPRTLTIALDEVLPRDRVIATDSGHFMGFPIMYLGVHDAPGFVFTQAFQSIGLGLATAIGASVAMPERLTVAAVGDGGLLMGLSELETVARLRPRVLILVYNDRAYGAEALHFGPAGEPVDTVTFPDVDFAALANALGMPAVTVRTLADLQPVSEWCRDGAPGCFLVDAKVVPSVVGGGWFTMAFQGH